jgi:small subunit ribosomal protein S7
MPRRNRPPRRGIEPDVRYNSELVARFASKLTVSGKKSTAYKVLYTAFDIIEERTKKSCIEVFEQAVKNVTPLLEVRPRRVGGATYQIPMEVRPERRMSLAIRWLVQNARLRPGKSMAEKLASELMDAAAGQGASIKKREDTHRMAEANRAFAHYRW